MAIADLLGQLLNAQSMPQREVDDRFDQLAGEAEPDMLGEGVSEAFHSDQTPPFPDMVSQMFGQAEPQQRAGMLNQILASVGPAILAGGAGGILGRVLGGQGGMGSMGTGMGGLGGGMGGGMGGNMGGGLGAILGSLGGLAGGPASAGPMGGAMPGGMPQVTPEQAAQITPEQMREIAAQAQQQQPGVVEQLSGFAARNPQLVKVLGGVAMALIASRMSQRIRR